MAAQGFFFFFFSFSLVIAFILCVAIIPGGQAGNQIALSSVSVDNDNDTLVITVTYAAEYQPEISWILPKTSLVDLDYEQTDTFLPGEGQTTARIKHDVARTSNPQIYFRILILRNPDCVVKVYLQPFDDLIAMPPSTQTFNNFALRMSADGIGLDPGQDVVLGRWNTHIIAALSSPELRKFKVGDPWVRLSNFEYTRGEFSGRENYYGYDHVLEYDRNWSGRRTAKRMEIKVKNSLSAVGIFSLSNLRVTQPKRADSPVSAIEFSQNLYFLRHHGEAPVRENTVVIRNKHHHLLSEYDKPVHRRNPTFSLAVTGNPLPQVSLRRACSEMGEEEVEVYETRQNSRYEIVHFLRLKNATAVLPASLSVVARSGRMEAREIMSIGFPPSR